MNQFAAGIKANVLDISEDSFLLIMMGLLFVGVLVFACWIAGYSFGILKGTLAGDQTLPPPQSSHMRQGLKLLCCSLVFWAPPIFAFICVCLVFDAVRSEFSIRATWYVLAVTCAITPVILLGNLVGIARYAAFGNCSLIYRRRENVKLALTNLVATALLCLSVIATAVFFIATFSALSGLLYVLPISDLTAKDALGSFTFFFILLCFSIVCSHLMAAYAKRVAFCDNLNRSVNRGWQRSETS